MRERGQALILVLLLLSVAAGAALFSFFNSAKVTLDRDQKTADALAAAKAALIGYALRGGDCVPQPTCTPQNPQRPGEFPCPDTNNDGFDGGTCVAGRLGRIPWKTLGIPEPKDAAGETLWYAIAGPFRSYNSGALNSSPINSDSRGTALNPSLTVYASDGLTKLADGTNEIPKGAVAVIFAPGQALGAQSRSAATTAACATTGTTIAQNLCAANYLETSAGINNATTNGPFITGLRSATYNDRVITITTPEFIPIVEQRVARELKTMIQAYYDTWGYFPFAAKYDDPTGNCAMNERRGRLPLRIRVDPDPPNPPPPNPVCGTPPSITFPAGTGLAEWPGSLPTWFGPNQWYKVMYYSVAAGYVYSYPPPRSCAGVCLTVGANTSVPALFFTPGTPANNAWRTATLDTILCHYLEDPVNQDGWTGCPPPAVLPPPDDTYVTPTSALFDRDRVFVLAGGASNPQCANNAAALLALTPCGQPPKLNPQCSTLAANIVNAPCSCSTAATQMINPPCQNTLKPAACQAAVATLKTCT